MKNRKTFLLLLMILPWLSAPLLGKHTFRKFGLSAIFICTLTKAIHLFGEKMQWWRFYKGIPPFRSMNFFNLGPYFVTSLWVLRWTFGKLPLYLLTNCLLQIAFIFGGGVEWATRWKVFKLVRISKWQYFFIDLCRALSLYGFQYHVERAGDCQNAAK
ncbi:hypothetical protein [Tuberibacillus calidus]|jgi:hypothetical protein|uniref:hypothetical protein n=1 Tax=Tuberibacillus calidus TaxID=340097 RepID=UPI0003FB418D|nr:hypothetical protein [Tuberibacillus calidus]